MELDAFTSCDEFRVETDTLGSVSIPAKRLWGAQTQRAIVNFPVGGSRSRWGRSVIRALGVVKRCAALANCELGVVSPEKCDLIAQASAEVIEGRWDDEFPLTMFQSGSGTQTNMNANEVIANRASQLAGGVLGSKNPIHPNDDVNCSQSSNDVFPSVMHIAAVDAIESSLLPALAGLARTFLERASAWSGLPLIGRTHLQDAVPLTLGNVFSGWQAQIDQAALGVRQTLPGLSELALGATAVGTGLNSPAGFDATVSRQIAEATGRAFVPAENKYAILSAHDAMVATSASLRTLAGALLKIANDIRWYASGPRAGIGEISLPENEPGSSIMPGKVNPTQCEMLTMVAVQVFGLDHAVAFAGSQGAFQLNVYKPLILFNVLESIGLLSQGCRSFDARCAREMTPREDVMRRHLNDSLMLATALSPHIGYDAAAKIAMAAHRQGITLRAAALQSGLVTSDQFDEWIRSEMMKLG